MAHHFDQFITFQPSAGWHCSPLQGAVFRGQPRCPVGRVSGPDVRPGLHGLRSRSDVAEVTQQRSHWSGRGLHDVALPDQPAEDAAEESRGATRRANTGVFELPVDRGRKLARCWGWEKNQRDQASRLQRVFVTGRKQNTNDQFFSRTLNRSRCSSSFFRSRSSRLPWSVLSKSGSFGRVENGFPKVFEQLHIFKAKAVSFRAQRLVCGFGFLQSLKSPWSLEQVNR